jgi:N-glycosidase YbiA
MVRIEEFQREYRFLSNFWPALVEFDGDIYPSVEHAYQAAKTLDLKDRKWIRESETPGIAKKRGRHVTIRSDWDSVKLSIMETLLREKFMLNASLKEKLLATGDAHLIEGNKWKDTFWGICNGVGQNHLGKLLMKIRAEIVQSVGDTSK